MALTATQIYKLLEQYKPHLRDDISPIADPGFMPQSSSQ